MEKSTLTRQQLILCGENMPSSWAYTDFYREGWGLSSYSLENMPVFLMRDTNCEPGDVSKPCNVEVSSGEFRTLEFLHRWAESTEVAGEETSAWVTWQRSQGPEIRTSSPVGQTSGHLKNNHQTKESTLSSRLYKVQKGHDESSCDLKRRRVAFLRSQLVFGYAWLGEHAVHHGCANLFSTFGHWPTQEATAVCQSVRHSIHIYVSHLRRRLRNRGRLISPITSRFDGRRRFHHVCETVPDNSPQHQELTGWRWLRRQECTEKK